MHPCDPCWEHFSRPFVWGDGCSGSGAVIVLRVQAVFGLCAVSTFAEWMISAHDGKVFPLRCYHRVGLPLYYRAYRAIRTG